MDPGPVWGRGGGQVFCNAQAERGADVKRKRHTKYLPGQTTEWQDSCLTTEIFLLKEMERSRLPGHAPRKIIENKAGQLALSRVI